MSAERIPVIVLDFKFVSDCTGNAENERSDLKCSLPRFTKHSAGSDATI